MTEYIYQRCIEANVGWFEAHGWEVVGTYEEEGLSMALMRHTASMRHVGIEEEEENGQ